MRDYDIRIALVDRLRAQHSDTLENRIWSELSLVLGASRVDVCLVNGALSGFEIKSPRDNLGRLDAQVRHYGLVLDYAHVVVTSKDLERVTARIPRWWGIIEASDSAGSVNLRPHRDGTPNPFVDPISVAQLLWRDEALDELSQRGLSTGLSKATRWRLWDMLVENLSLDELQEAVRGRLKSRPPRQADLPYTRDDGMSRSPAK